MSLVSALIHTHSLNFSLTHSLSLSHCIQPVVAGLLHPEFICTCPYQLLYTHTISLCLSPPASCSVYTAGTARSVDVGMLNEILDVQSSRLFSNEPFEKRPAMTIQDFV